MGLENREKHNLHNDNNENEIDNDVERSYDAELNELDTVAMDFMDTRLDDIDYVRKLIEAVMLMSPEPIAIKRIARTLGIKNGLVEKATEQLKEDYINRGIIIQHIGDGIQFGTNPDIAEHLEKFFQMEKRRRISRAGLQVLSIIAYNQPITKAEIENFRGGINSAGVIQSLLERDLVKIAARKDAPGNPFLYSVSDEFLKYFGLRSAEELKAKLPAIEDEIARDGGITQLQLKDMGILEESDKTVTVDEIEYSVSDNMTPSEISDETDENKTGDDSE